MTTLAEEYGVNTDRPWPAPKRPEMVTVEPEFVVRVQGGKEAILYKGLLDAAVRHGLEKMEVTLLQSPDEGNGNTAIVHARAIFPWGTHEEIGDANPRNVGGMVAAHFIRMAATRSKARALRDALNIGLVSVEELDREDPTPQARTNPNIGVVVTGGDPDEDEPTPQFPPATPAQVKMLWAKAMEKESSRAVINGKIRKAFGVDGIDSVYKKDVNQAIALIEGW